jgi:glucosamine--fructose-6-phosphate aminotransferase (isomerizing)
MLAEARSAPACVARQLEANAGTLARLAASLRATPPSAAVTLARGSSDHAASYFAYLTMSRLGRVVASLPMSLVTLQRAPLQAQGMLALAISQSGQSPDVVEPVRYFRAGGGTTVALVNHADSPLAHAAQWVLPLHAGEERSVAATKSFITSLAAGAALVANWQGDADLLAGLRELPAALEEAAKADWSPALEALCGADSIMVVGRGTGHAIALEAALKFKETSALQAEAFSSAEIRHGPMALVRDGYPLLVFAPRGAAQAGLLDMAREMRGRGARVLLAAPADVPGRELTLPAGPVPDLDPIAAIQAFYGFAVQLALARGLDPDRPRHLSKVTKTI